jgi:hypothetical protein
MEKNIIILIIVLFIITNCVNFGLFFNNRKNIEKMSNTDDAKIKELITSIYKVDIQAIRNLSDISKKLQQGGITIPGDITIEGNINLKKDLKMVNNASIRSTGRLHLVPEESLYLIPKKGTLLTKSGGSAGTLHVDGKIKGMGELDIASNINLKGELDIAGNINLKKDLRMVNGASIRSTGRLHIAPEEKIYLLPKKGTMVTKDQGASGSIDVANINTGTINANTISTKKIKPLYNCAWFDLKGISKVTHAADYKFGDLIPTKWDHGGHHKKAGFLVVDRNDNGHEYVTGTAGNHIHHDRHLHPNGSHKRTDMARN